MQEEDEWFPTARLQRFLQAQFYAGKSIWRVLLTPLLWGAAMFFFLLAGWSMWQSRSPYNPWDMERIEWGRPPPSLLQRWRTRANTKMGRIRLRLPGLAKQKMAEIPPKGTPPAPATATPNPPKKPTQPVLPLFGSAMGEPNGEPKEGFRWEETKGIE